MQDVWDAAVLFGESKGVPTIGNEVSGAADVVTGSPAKGLMKLGGYTDYRAKHITEDE